MIDNNTCVYGQYRKVSTWANSIAAGVAASDPVAQVLVAASSTYIYLIQRIEITLVTAVATSLALHSGSSGAGTASSTSNFMGISALLGAGRGSFEVPQMATAWSVAPSAITYPAKQMGYLANVGDKLIWEWPEYAPFAVACNGSSSAGHATIYNAGAGVTGGLYICVIGEIMAANRLTSY